MRLSSGLFDGGGTLLAPFEGAKRVWRLCLQTSEVYWEK